MKIAILGSRGIPARYGGFETLAEQLSARLTARGHEVIVYCRSAFCHPEDQIDPKIKRVILPSINSKYFDTFVHTLRSVVHVSSTKAELVLIVNVANSVSAWIPRLFGKPTVLNVDGLDRRRSKWNVLGRGFLYFCEILSAITPTKVLTDSSVIYDYYLRRYRKQSAMIPYGAEKPSYVETWPIDRSLSKRYLLYVSRLEPEYNAELVINAYCRTGTDWPLIIVGGSSYDPAYVTQLRRLADPRVIFTGPVYGDGYWTLQDHAGVFVYAGEVGGTHPALLEAMAAENPILYLDTPENRETVADAGMSFAKDVEQLASLMQKIIADEDLRSSLAREAVQRVLTTYSWEKITDEYEALFRELLTANHS